MNATASWKEDDYSDGKWKVGGLQNYVFHLRDVIKKEWKNTIFLVAK